jgi:hypothetical protein
MHERDEDSDTDGRITLREILRKQGVRVRTGFMGLRKGTICRML